MKEKNKFYTTSVVTIVLKMPYKKRYRKRRRSKRKRRRNRSIMRVPGLLIPDTTYVTLKYQTSVTLNAGDNFQNFVFSGNGIFNPGLSVDNGVPAGFPEWMSFYNFYQVNSSSIKVLTTNLVNNEAKMLIIPKNVSGISTMGVSEEQPYSTTIILARPSSGKGSRTLRKSMSTRKIIGRSINDLSYVGGVASNPIDQWYWHVQYLGLELPDSPTTDLEFSQTVHIIYRIRLFDRRTVL